MGNKLMGKVISAKCDKTRVVVVDRKFIHKKYGKVMNEQKKYMVHDENNSTQEGDIVSIKECRPISKRKSWEIVQDSI